MLDPVIRELARGKNFGSISFHLPGGEIATHVMWVDADDEHVLINTEVHRTKYKAIQANPNVTLTAIKKAEDSDALVFRMYEWAGTASDVKLHIPPGATYAIETNLMEKPEGPHLNLSGDVVTVPIKPYEILTIEATYPQKN